jgi:hypothetical protein
MLILFPTTDSWRIQENNMEPNTSFFSRIAMACKIIFSKAYALSLLNPETSSVQAIEDGIILEPIETVSTLKHTDQESALQLLAILQKEGRLIDFINEDVSAFSDDQVAAAARVVHAGVKKALYQHMSFAPVSDTLEGNNIHLPADFDKNAYRLTGNITGSGPFNGTLVHKGWKVADLSLPQLADGIDLHVVAAAEVEL